jgi:plastocyanin
MLHHHAHSRSRMAAAIMPVVLALALILVVAVVATACGGSASTTTSGGAAAGGQVVMKGFAFSPGSITIKVGESVTWTNQDGTTHTVTANNGEFSSGNIASGGGFTFKFDKAGTYPYHCSIHSTMKGTIVVQ